MPIRSSGCGFTCRVWHGMYRSHTCEKQSAEPGAAVVQRLATPAVDSTTATNNVTVTVRGLTEPGILLSAEANVLIL